MLAVTVIMATGCGVVNSIRAKNELNEGARSYRAGRFAEAQQPFQAALEYDPESKNAPFFVARSIHAQFRPGVESQENVAKANEAIAAYQKVLENDPNNDEAYNAVAYLYRAIKSDDKELEWLMKRANLESAPTDKRSDAFTVLASKQWSCSQNITEQKSNQQMVQKDGKVVVQYKKPADQKEFDDAMRCSTRGLELVEKAISLNPKSEQAWAYKTNLLREMAKLAEMEGNSEKRTEYSKQADVAQAETAQLSEENKRKKEEAERAKAATG